MGVNSLPVTRQRRGCDLNPGRTAPESSTLTTRLPSHLISFTFPIISSPRFRVGNYPTAFSFRFKKIFCLRRVVIWTCRCYFCAESSVERLEETESQTAQVLYRFDGIEPLYHSLSISSATRHWRN